MDDDAIASCWQANLGKDPGAGAQTVKENCTTVWEGRKTLKCEMIFEQVCALNAEASAQMCARDNLSSLKNEDGHKWCPLKDKDGNLIDKLAAGEAAVEEPTTVITQ